MSYQTVQVEKVICDICGNIIADVPTEVFKKLVNDPHEYIPRRCSVCSKDLCTKCHHTISSTPNRTPSSSTTCVYCPDHFREVLDKLNHLLGIEIPTDTITINIQTVVDPIVLTMSPADNILAPTPTFQSGHLLSPGDIVSTTRISTSRLNLLAIPHQHIKARDCLKILKMKSKDYMRNIFSMRRCRHERRPERTSPKVFHTTDGTTA